MYQHSVVVTSAYIRHGGHAVSLGFIRIYRRKEVLPGIMTENRRQIGRSHDSAKAHPLLVTFGPVLVETSLGQSTPPISVSPPQILPRRDEITCQDLFFLDPLMRSVPRTSRHRQTRALLMKSLLRRLHDLVHQPGIHSGT